MELDIRSEEYKLFTEIVETIEWNVDKKEAEKIILKLGELLEKVSLPSETLSCEQTAAILRILIKQIANDMVVIYAPEECGVEAVKELRERISKNHSTLVYIGLQEKLALDLIDKMVAR